MVRGALKRELRVPIEGGIHLRCRIDNPAASEVPLVLLNGAAFNLGQWDRILRFGAWKRHLEVVRFDYAGTGGSSPRPRPVTVERLAAETVELLDALEIERAHFFGLSQGTIVLQGIAALAPERIASAAGYGWYCGDAQEAVEAAARGIRTRVEAFGQLRDIWDAPLDRANFERLWAAVYRPVVVGASWDALSWSGRLRDLVMRRVLHPLLAPTSIGAIAEWFSYCVDPEGLAAAHDWLRSGLDALQDAPVLIQHAEADDTLGVGMARALHRVLPRSEAKIYGDGYGHISVAFRRDHARTVVDDHLAFLRASRADRR